MWKWLTGLIAGLIITAFGIWWESDRPKLQYSLSDALPEVESLDGEPGVLQLLTVVNSGSAPSELIQLRLPAHAEVQRVLKQSLSHDPQWERESGFLELRYPELPAESQFSIMVLAREQLTSADIVVRDRKGVAEPAVTGSRVGAWLFLLPAIYFGLIVIEGWKALRRYEADRLRFASFEKTVEKKRPAWFTSEKWSEAKRDALKDKLASGDSPYQEPMRWNSWKLIASDRAADISEAEWGELVRLATEQWKTQIKYTELGNRVAFVNDLVKQPKPNSIPSSEWSDLVCTAYKKALSYDHFFEKDEWVMKDLLEFQPPPDVAADKWQEAALNGVMSSASSLLAYFRTYGIWKESLTETFPEKARTFLQRMVDSHAAQQWIRRPQDAAAMASASDSLRAEAQRLANQLDEGQRFKRLISQLAVNPRLALAGEDHPDDEEQFREWTKGLLLKMEEAISRGDELARETRQLTEEKAKVEAKVAAVESDLAHKDARLAALQTRLEEHEAVSEAFARDRHILTDSVTKLRRQLEFIDRLLKDPAEIERVEEHDDRFSRGNWENLREVARALETPKI